jgi:hypothetical protein
LQETPYNSFDFVIEPTEKLLPTPSTAAPLFVVGPFRSGTSLLYALLNQHPQIALMYECDVWNFPQALSHLRFRGDWLTRLEFYGRALSRHRLVLGDRLDGLENVRTPLDLYRIFAQNKDARFFGEKSPFYCNRLGQLAKKHPGCSFILIWRDPLEIYRSIEEAARNSYYFRRRGILSRLLFYQEKMIHEAAGLIRSGNRVHHVTYADLIDRREEACRGICRFLEIEFDTRMTDLTGADLSAVFHAPQHEHLRRGIIERRPASENNIPPAIAQKLQRYRHRWNRLRRQMLDHQESTPAGPEPAILERLYQRAVGSFFCGMDSAIRSGFEFLPLPWLRTYRQTKAWFKAEHSASARPWHNEFLENKATLLLSAVILTLVAIADYYTGFAVSLMLFYLVPASILTLVIGRRWGTLGAVLSVLVWALVQNATSPFLNFSHLAVLLWDAFMRLSVTEIVVLLLDRIRIEIASQKTFRD